LNKKPSETGHSCISGTEKSILDLADVYLRQKSSKNIQFPALNLDFGVKNCEILNQKKINFFQFGPGLLTDYRALKKDDNAGEEGYSGSFHPVSCGCDYSTRDKGLDEESVLKSGPFMRGYSCARSGPRGKVESFCSMFSSLSMYTRTDGIGSEPTNAVNVSFNDDIFIFMSLPEKITIGDLVKGDGFVGEICYKPNAMAFGESFGSDIASILFKTHCLVRF
jgi:hypothetical protein